MARGCTSLGPAPLAPSRGLPPRGQLAERPRAPRATFQQLLGGAPSKDAARGSASPADHGAALGEGRVLPADRLSAGAGAGRGASLDDRDERQEGSGRLGAGTSATPWVEAGHWRLSWQEPRGLAGVAPVAAAWSAEHVVATLLERVAWGVQGRRGTVRLEVGRGRFAGAVITLTVEEGVVGLQVEGDDGDLLLEQLSARLRAQGQPLR